ncbi:DUF485 domain-containing protein [Streptomyces spectabilis]|uniref:DUF485 domain-containing protein n=1 Tax=Streptomyces spectabilis TaxID=68270 RepID=A0A516R546_STRST|nr:DUF485 domain-containing protein [Streptomyces spectabilis]
MDHTASVSVPATPVPRGDSVATDAPPPSKGGPEPTRSTPSTAEYVDMQQSPEFGELRTAHRSFAFPLTIAFITWYLGYVLLSNYAGDFMGTKVIGNINIALVLGLAQFLTTFLIAWWYSRHAAAKLDPRADAIKSRMEGGA